MTRHLSDAALRSADGSVGPMWLPDKSKIVRIRLHSRGEDVETAWAEDLGVVPGRPGARRVRVGNVLYVHAKPTYGDVLIVERSLPGGMLTWDSLGLPCQSIGERIEEDGGRYLVIIDYTLGSFARGTRAAFAALDTAGEDANIAVEGCFGPKDGKPGRACLAVPYELQPEDVLKYLRERNLPMSLTLVHPMPG